MAQISQSVDVILDLLVTIFLKTIWREAQYYTEWQTNATTTDSKPSRAVVCETFSYNQVQMASTAYQIWVKYKIISLVLFAQFFYC